jgi:hypothetical protein
MVNGAEPNYFSKKWRSVKKTHFGKMNLNQKSVCRKPFDRKVIRLNHYEMILDQKTFGHRLIENLSTERSFDRKFFFNKKFVKKVICPKVDHVMY